MANEKTMKGDVLEFASHMKKLVNNKDHRYCYKCIVLEKWNWPVIECIWIYDIKQANYCLDVSAMLC